MQDRNVEIMTAVSMCGVYYGRHYAQERSAEHMMVDNMCEKRNVKVMITHTGKVSLVYNSSQYV